VFDLNLFFGFVTIGSFLYAVWANRELTRVKTIRNTIISEIRKLAQKISTQGSGTAIEGYADSIVSFCNSISDGPSARPRLVGPLKLYFFAINIPPMQTQNGRREVDDAARMGYALTGSWVDPSKKYLVFGPYKPLPLFGTYIAKFRLRYVYASPDVSRTEELIRLDVYDYNGGKQTLASRLLTVKDLHQFYIEYPLEFKYTREQQALEYRVVLLRSGITLSVDYISIELCE
jgi:hypothetical protein